MKKVIFGIVALALSALVVFTSLNTGENYAEAAGVIGPWVNAHLFFGRLNAEEVSNLTGFGSKLFGHFALFALTGLFSSLFLSSLLKKRTAWVLYLCYGLILASLGEVIQIFVAGRSPSVADVAVNLAGYLLLPLIHRFYRRLNPPR